MAVYRTVLVADLHAGSTVAPWPDGAPLPDGGTWKLSRPQRMLNRHWEMMQEELRKFDHINSVVVLGDAVDGGNPKASLVTDRVDYQADAAVELLTPLREMTDKFYMVRGTEWHTGKCDEHVSAAAKQLDAVANPLTKEVTWPELYLDMGGPVVHFAHHIGGATNPLYEATAALRALGSLTLELYATYGRAAPHLMGIARAHRHRTIAISKNGRWAVVVAGWKLKDNFAHKVATDTLPEIGYAVWECDDGALNAWTRTFPLPAPHVERA